MAQEPAGTDDTTSAISQIGGESAASAGQGMWIEPGEQALHLGPDRLSKVTAITFPGATVFNHDYLSKTILSREAHWYHVLSPEWVIFHGPVRLKGPVCISSWGAWGFAVSVHIDIGIGKNDSRTLGQSYTQIPIEYAEYAVRYLYNADISLDNIQLRMSTEDIYNPYMLAVDKYRILHNYRALGYLDVDVRPQAQKDAAGTGTTLTYTVSEGERYRFGSINLVSNIEGYSPEDLRYAIDIEPGNWFDPARIEDVETKLNDVKFSSGPLFKALNGHQPFSVTIKPEVAKNTAGKVVNVTFTINRSSSPAAKPSKPATALLGQQIGCSSAKRIGVASADGGGSR